jgi:hypothetical protein
MSSVPFDFSDLYTVRMIVLMETEPQSNLYRQVRLTAPEFKQLSDTIADIMKTDDGMAFDLGNELMRLPDRIEDFYAAH